jgi:rhodanese-related sulfurtransferase
LLVKYQVFAPDQTFIQSVSLKPFLFAQNMTEFVTQNIMLVMLFLVSGGMLLWPLLSKVTGGSREIGTLETTRLMNSGNALVLDIRDTAEFGGGRIPKSKNIPFSEIDKRIDEIAKFKDKPVIVTCGANSRGNAAMRLLKQRGFVDVYQLDGGLGAWQQASLPVEK